MMMRFGNFNIPRLCFPEVLQLEIYGEQPFISMGGEVPIQVWQTNKQPSWTVGLELQGYG